MQVNGNPDYIEAQAFNVFKVLFGVFIERNRPGASSAEPAGKVNPPVEGILCRKLKGKDKEGKDNGIYFSHINIYY
jgi:hypothetical protein